MKPHTRDSDQYERSAEFVDVMLAPVWTALDPVLTEALRGAPGPALNSSRASGDRSPW
ncbi:hypothetical protein ACIBQ1_28620 [Nonomuraea sp. NPDC050153]|uniref:hypothetical protein n=1 Tax=Nonomuraea sp. NPDC050153 TaxID=3364359 RepID=UPI00379C9883